MPYWKVPVTIELAGYRYVEADDKDAAIDAAAETDLSVPYIQSWPDSGEPVVGENEEQVEEVNQDEYEENQDD